MKVQVKNIKVARFASEDSLCFQASIYIDGKRVGVASDQGMGGGMMIDIEGTQEHERAIIKQLHEHAKATMPVFDCMAEWGIPGTMEPTAETLLDDLVQKFLTTKELKQKLSKSLLYLENDKIYGFKLQGRSVEQIRELAYKAGKLTPDNIVLNNLNIDAAVELWEQHA